jgi:hypothetical protein
MFPGQDATNQQWPGAIFCESHALEDNLAKIHQHSNWHPTLQHVQQSMPMSMKSVYHMRSTGSGELLPTLSCSTNSSQGLATMRVSDGSSYSFGSAHFANTGQLPRAESSRAGGVPHSSPLARVRDPQALPLLATYIICKAADAAVPHASGPQLPQMSTKTLLQDTHDARENQYEPQAIGGAQASEAVC